MSTPEAEQEPETRVTRTRSQKMSSSPEKIAPAESQTTVAGKKESFQWSTPADEFADDVGSDIEDIGDEIEHYDVDDSISDSNTRTEIDKETGGIIISLGSDEANKYSVSSDDSKASPQKKHKKAKSKQQFPCPKCDKVWNWPWELRRHLVMHFKEVINDTQFNYLHYQKLGLGKMLYSA